MQAGAVRGGAQAAQIAVVGMSMIALATLMNELREFITFGPKGNPNLKNETETEKFWRGLERTGMFGAGQFALDAINAQKFGSDTLDPILGPTVSQGTALFKGLVSAGRSGEISDKLKTEILKAIPGLSLSPKLRDLFRETIEDI
jgi:hypothetical protein